MRKARLTAPVIAGCVLLLGAAGVGGQDWPQWMGPNRDARATGFKAPANWPKELKQKWKLSVGDGVASPSLVGDKLYVFTRQGSDEILRCLDAGTGKEIWKDSYAAKGADGPARGFAGPRASPTVTQGKVVTFGARGKLSCVDADSGKLLWRKDTGSVPQFYTSCSPVVTDGLVIAQLGGERRGSVASFELDGGKEKWRWADDGTGYASPSLLTLGKDKVLVTLTQNNVVSLNPSDGKLLWKTPFVVTGRGYNAASPVSEGQMVVYAGTARGTRAVKLDREGDKVTAKDLWRNPDTSVTYNSPIIKGDLVFGITTSGNLFCLSARDGKTQWTAPLGARGRDAAYGSVVDAGSVMFALTPAGQLVVFEPTAKEFKRIASYKVADGYTFAYPVLSGNRVYIKDRDSLTLWAIE